MNHLLSYENILNMSLFTDFLYTHRVAFDGVVSEVEILDTSNCAVRYYTFPIFMYCHPTNNARFDPVFEGISILFLGYSDNILLET